jgi:hypothetical protein
MLSTFFCRILSRRKALNIVQTLLLLRFYRSIMAHNVLLEDINNGCSYGESPKGSVVICTVLLYFSYQLVVMILSCRHVKGPGIEL